MFLCSGSSKSCRLNLFKHKAFTRSLTPPPISRWTKASTWPRVEALLRARASWCSCPDRPPCPPSPPRPRASGEIKIRECSDNGLKCTFLTFLHTWAERWSFRTPISNISLQNSIRPSSYRCTFNLTTAETNYKITETGAAPSCYHVCSSSLCSPSYPGPGWGESKEASSTTSINTWVASLKVVLVCGIYNIIYNIYIYLDNQSKVFDLTKRINVLMEKVWWLRAVWIEAATPHQSPGHLDLVMRNGL